MTVDDETAIELGLWLGDWSVRELQAAAVRTIPTPSNETTMRLRVRPVRAAEVFMVVPLGRRTVLDESRRIAPVDRNPLRQPEKSVPGRHVRLSTGSARCTVGPSTDGAVEPNLHRLGEGPGATMSPVHTTTAHRRRSALVGRVSLHRDVAPGALPECGQSAVVDSYSSCRRNQPGVSFRPSGARSSHWNIDQSSSPPRA